AAPHPVARLKQQSAAAGQPRIRAASGSQRARRSPGYRSRYSGRVVLEDQLGEPQPQRVLLLAPDDEVRVLGASALLLVVFVVRFTAHDLDPPVKTGPVRTPGPPSG